MYRSWRFRMASKLLKVISDSTRPLVFGMIHVPALPGTPKSKLSMNGIDEIVKHEANVYKKAGVDGIILENMHDLPYAMSKNVGPETVAAMTRLSISAKRIFSVPQKPSLIGIQILAGANCQALSVAAAAELDFIRAECFVFAHVADEGIMQGNAAELMRLRRNINAESVAIITDIKKKHSSHSITADVNVGEMAHATEFFLGDGVILTGNATGQAANVRDIEEVRRHSSLPIFIGSGITSQNAKEFKSADGFIVGSYFKKNGKWQENLDPEIIQKFMQQILSF